MERNGATEPVGFGTGRPIRWHTATRMHGRAEPDDDLRGTVLRAAIVQDAVRMPEVRVDPAGLSGGAARAYADRAPRMRRELINSHGRESWRLVRTDLEKMPEVRVDAAGPSGGAARE